MHGNRGHSSPTLISFLLLAVGCSLTYVVSRHPIPHNPTRRTHPTPPPWLFAAPPITDCRAVGAAAAAMPPADASGLIHTFHHGATVEAVLFSPDGRRMAAVGGGTLDLWCVSNGLRLWSARSKGTCLAFAPGGTILLVGGEEVEQWDIRSGTRTVLSLAPLASGLEPGVSSLVFAQSGHLLIGGRPFDAPSAWDTRTWRQSNTLNSAEGIAAISPNGRVVSLGSTLYDAHTLQKKRELVDTIGDSTIHCSALSPDGRFLLAHTARVASYPDQHMVMWDTRTGRELGQLDHNALCVSAAFSPDSKLIATGCDDDTVKLWNIHRRLLTVLPCHQAAVNSVAFSPNGRFLASASADGTIKLWRVADMPHRRPQPPDIRGCRIVMSNMYKIEPDTLSNDGRLLLTHDVESDKVWNAVTGRLIHDEGPRHYNSALSRNGRLLATFEENQGVAIWRTDSWVRVRTLPWTKWYVDDLRFTPLADSLCISDGQGESVWWDLSRGRQTGPRESAALEATTYSNDGSTAVRVGDSGQGAVWRRGADHPCCVLDGSVAGAKARILSLRGNRLAAIWSSRQLRCWDLKTGRRTASFRLTDRNLDADDSLDYTSVAFSPDDRWLITYVDDTVQVWDASAGRLHAALKPFAGGITAAAFSPDSRVIAVGGENGTVQLWDPRTGTRLHAYTGPALPIRLVAFTPDHYLVAFGSNHTRLVLWRIQYRPGE